MLIRIDLPLGDPDHILSLLYLFSRIIILIFPGEGVHLISLYLVNKVLENCLCLGLRTVFFFCYCLFCSVFIEDFFAWKGIAFTGMKGLLHCYLLRCLLCCWICLIFGAGNYLLCGFFCRLGVSLWPFPSFLQIFLIDINFLIISSGKLAIF